MTARRPKSLPTALAFVTASLIAALLIWRAALPNNRHQGNLDFAAVKVNGVSYYLPNDITHYEDGVARTTAYNFARDGFLRTHFLPNRHGFPRVSMYDFTGTMCEQIAPPKNVLTHWNGLGQKVDTLSANNDCIYTHYPPFTEWIFGSMALLGLDQVLHYKIVAILVNWGFLLVCFFWFRRQVHPLAALTALLLTGTLPGFLQWGDTLYYHSFQYLFLMAGLLTWTRYLQEGRPLWFAFTWLLYFLESLSSFQLTLFFGVALFGLAILENSLKSHIAGLALQAAAPVTAFTGHFLLTASLIGFDRAWLNVTKTYVARTVELHEEGLGPLMSWLSRGLVPWTLIVTGPILVVAARRLAGASLRRPLGHLAILWFGGVSFTAALPGTSTMHDHMMYRHLMPFVALLIAYVADALLMSLCLARDQAAQVTHSSRWLKRVASIACVMLCLGYLGWILHRNTLRVKGEIGWNLVRNAYHAPGNLVLQAVDTFYWRERVPLSRGVQRLPVSGMRVSEPPAWSTDFQIIGPEPSNYEIWWLAPTRMAHLRLLVDQADALLMRDHCTFHYFDGNGFVPLPDRTRIATARFIPQPNERKPFVPYAWLSFSVDAPIAARAVRLVCAGFGHAALRQIEIFNKTPNTILEESNETLGFVKQNPSRHHRSGRARGSEPGRPPRAPR